jgi:transposase
MTTFLTVQALLEDGVPKKTIARRLGIDRRTVRKYAMRCAAGARAPERAPVRCKLDACRALVDAKVQQGLSAAQVYHDLRREVEGFEASYSTVRRLVRTLRRVEPEVYCRMHFAPGEEAQVDFGEIGRLLVDGASRKVYLFALTLCYSRSSYYELVVDQKVSTFLGALRRGFEHFGGVPARLKPDNLHAAVLIDQLGQRYYQRDFFDFCRHYGTVPDAARPRTPTDKGRTERDIGYVKGSCFRGRSDLVTLEQGRAHLARWHVEVADVRIHGTTQRRPCDLFEVERHHLRPLPKEPYAVSEWGHYLVRKDCHIALLANYYSVPHRFVGQRVFVRLAEDEVAVFADDVQVARHVRSHGRGETITDPSHYPAEKRLSTQEIHRRRTLRLREAGPHVAAYLGRLKESRFVKADQLARLVRLLEGHGASALDLACRRALHFEALDGAKTVARILETGLHLQALPEASPGAAQKAAGDFGRPLEEYSALLAKEVA